jgi:hypothetical protein
MAQSCDAPLRKDSSMVKNRISVSLLTLLAAFLVTSNCAHGPQSKAPSVSSPAPLMGLSAATVPSGPPLMSAPVRPKPQLPQPRPNGACKINGELQDRACTPGVTSPLVTQANIQETVCTPGYSTKIRAQYAPSTYTGALKRLQIKEYGYSDTNPAHYEEDHLISLELGGHPNDPRNLWPEPGASPNAKDAIENLLHQRVCSGEISLVDAQRAISTDWKAVH